eukprot:6182115-Pleurochrysis_carterae.AAC.2
MTLGRTYIPIHKSRSHTLARATHADDGEVNVRAGGHEVLPTHFGWAYTIPEVLLNKMCLLKAIFQNIRRIVMHKAKM